MATNKHATIRYHALDRCFANTGRRYYIEDLIEACNVALYDYTGVEDGNLKYNNAMIPDWLERIRQMGLEMSFK